MPSKTISPRVRVAGPAELLRTDSATYDATADLEMVRKVGALAGLLTSVLAASMLAIWPPTHGLGAAAGWSCAATSLLLLAALCVLTMLRRRFSLQASLAMTLLSIVTLGGLELLAGGASRYTTLVGIPVMFVGASQAPRRVALTIALAALVEVAAVGKLGISAGSVAAAAENLIVWAVMTGLALVWTAGVRWQRLALRDEQEQAQHLALHDAVTGLGNRRKLIADLEDAVAQGEPAALVLFDLNGFKAYNDSFGHLAGDVLLTRLATKLAADCAGVATAYRMGGDEFCLLARGRGVEAQALLARGRAALTERGHGFQVSAAGGTAVLPAEVTDPVDALRLADGRMYADKQERRGRAAADGAEMLLAIVQERDPSLSRHCDSVARIAEALADRLGVPEARRGQLIRAAELHDIGKLAVPDAILSKPGPLDDDEWAFIRRHPVIGERVVSCAPDLVAVAGIIRATHERVDGTGYPDGLCGEEIPLASRIIAVCDAFVAMSSTRAYRPALTPDAIVEELQHGAGRQFDGRVVAALLEVLAGDLVRS